MRYFYLNPLWCLGSLVFLHLSQFYTELTLKEAITLFLANSHLTEAGVSWLMKWNLVLFQGYFSIGAATVPVQKKGKHKEHQGTR